MGNPQNPGWYEDPQDDSQLRYFDGVVWSKHTTPRQTRPQAPQPQPVDPTLTWRHEGNVHGPGGGQGQQSPYQQYGQTPGQQGPGQPAPWRQQPAGTAPANFRAAPDGTPLASYWQRVGAYLIDAVVLGIVTLVLLGWLFYRAMQPFFSALADALETNDPSALDALDPLALVDMQYFVPAVVLSYLLGVLYHVGFVARSGQTPGKRLVGISVRRRDRAGAPGVAVAARRYALPLLLNLLGSLPVIGSLAVIGWILDLLWPAWDDQRQAWHDKVADTLVVQGSQQAQTSPPGQPGQPPYHGLR
ncbi:RDD family protein [Janibacter sp. G56]|uniref:RDD family protein n=1 Tax=Janibacter sp. G56 TaxID=3418717 RepID=UPI003CFCC7DA